MNITLTSADFEQGGISSTGNYNSSGNIRTQYMPVTDTNLQDITFSANSSTGKHIQLDILVYSSNTYVRPNADLYWLDFPCTKSITSTEWNYIRLALRFSDSSNISPQDIEYVKIESKCEWQMTDNGIENTEFYSDSYAEYMERPYPYTVWRIDDEVVDGQTYSGGGEPYNLLLPDVLLSIKYTKLVQNPYITVHDYLTKQTDFDDNGLAVLRPTSCIISETLNGEYSLELKHNIDDTGKWTYLKEFNYIKALEQIFRINKATVSYSGGKGEITVNATHVFYVLNDAWMFKGSWLHGGDVYNLIREMLQKSRIPSMYTDSQVFNSFTYSSDLKIDRNVASEKWGYNSKVAKGIAPLDVIMGSDGIIQVAGGELYRDNFYFSVYSSMENSKDNAFEIHIGNNLKGIKRDVDFSTFCSYLMVHDNHDSYFAIGYTGGILWSIPHHIAREVTFEYDNPNVEMLVSDAWRYWYQNAYPVIGYTVDLQETENNSEFKEYSGKPEYKVGNWGTVYDKRIGINIKLKITQVKKDAITGRVKSVTFGSIRSFVSRDYNPKVIDVDVPIHTETVTEIQDANGYSVKTADGYILKRKVESDNG